MPPVFIKGNLKRTRVAERGTRRGKALGKPGFEGMTRSISMRVQRGEKARSVVLAEKEFFHPDYSNPSIYNPRLQVRFVHELMRLNRERKLGLNLPVTVRLVERKNKPYTIASSKMKFLELAKLSEIENWAKKGRKLHPLEEMFLKDALRQKKIADMEGYGLISDCFKPVRGPDGHARAYIGDFGGIYSYKEVWSKNTPAYRAAQALVEVLQKQIRAEP